MDKDLGRFSASLRRWPSQGVLPPNPLSRASGFWETDKIGVEVSIAPENPTAKTTFGESGTTSITGFQSVVHV